MFEKKIKIDAKPLAKEAGFNIKNPFEKKECADKQKCYKFNTFSGVVVPSVLAIFGAVMYLILPKVIGGVGLLPALLIIAIAHSVSISTAFSLSGVATNIKVKGGGLYYLISRSLGSEFGGALGIQLFLAQTVSVSFYSIAFALGLNTILAMFNIVLPLTYLAFISCLLFGLISWFGANFVIKLQYVILSVIVLSIISIIFGTAPSGGTIDLIIDGSLPFWVAFAMFFPAVVGIDAGISMSGDLKDPKKSLVRGTFTAILFTFILYVLLAINIGYSASSEQLFNNPMIILKIAKIPALVLAGVLLATSSSALSYFMAAPRTLKALADDNIFSSKIKFLGKGIGNSPDPRAALLVSLIIALFVIMGGGLLFVSQVVTMFFLNVYGWINGAAFFEKISRNPSYRPSFNPPAVISFYGMFASYFIMYLFNPLVMVVSLLFQLLIFFILYKTQSSIKLESVWDGVLFQLLRGVVNKIEQTAKSKKNWRPTVVAFSTNPVNRNSMFSLLNWIGSHTGIVKFYYLISGKVEKNTKLRQDIEEDMKQYIKENELDLFPRVVETANIKQSVETILQSETIGNLPPNTALMDFDDRFQIDKLAKLTARLKKNVIIFRNNKGFSDFKFVDVWWDEPDNGNLMILLAYLITHSKTWMEHDASIRLFKVVKNQQDYDSFYKKLNKLADDSRIDNISVKIIIEKDKKMPHIIKENSHYSDLVLIGMPHAKKKGITKETMKEIKRYTDELTTSLIVLANDKIDFRIN